MALSTRPRFKLGANVHFPLSGERGTVIGISTYVDEVPSYLVRFVTSQGSIDSRWFNGSVIELDPRATEFDEVA